MKRCPKCKTEKDLSLFATDRSKKDGHTCWCSACRSAASVAWTKRKRTENPDFRPNVSEATKQKQKDWARNWRINNPELARERSNENRRRTMADPYRKAQAMETKRAWNNSEKGVAGERRRLMRRYGLTVEQHDALLKKQGGVCAICRQPDTEKKGNLVVDHDHQCCPKKDRSCGKCVRGLLCHKCNQAIGCLSDDVPTILRAADYLAAAREGKVDKDLGLYEPFFDARLEVLE